MKYKSIKVIECIMNADEFDEDKYTKKYMRKYWIDRVRGGAYCQIKLPEYLLYALEKELCNSSDLCFRCNRPGHYISQCYATTKADGSVINENKEESELSIFFGLFNIISDFFQKDVGDPITLKIIVMHHLMWMEINYNYLFLIYLKSFNQILP